jgi:predicted permease
MLRESGRGLTPSRSRMNVRRALVAAQMAFAVVLLVGASLMVRTFRNLRAVKPGFDVSGVVTMQIALPQDKYGRGGKFYFESATLASNFHEQLVTRVRQLPGVRHVGMSDHVPLISGDWCTGVNLEGPTPEIHRGACPSAALVSPGYFEAMGINVEGRSLDWNGMNAHDGAMVVSKAFADHHWPNESAVGKGLRFVGFSPPFYRVTGVAADVRGNGVDAPPIEIVYFPILPIPDAPLWEPATITNLVINGATADPAAVAHTVALVAQELEPQAAVANAQTMETVLAKSMAKQSFTMALLLLSAVIAMLLSAVGIYGVISYVVGQRKGEIGVRMALGAQVSEVTLMVLRQSMALSLVGIFAGVLAALATTRLLSTLLFGVTPTDVATLVAVPLSLLAVSLLATYAPARRVARIDPAEALRSE